MRHSSILLTAALSLMAAPLAAQTFSLPPGPSSTPTPEVEGPVDDSGVVPVRPRDITRPSPTPTPTPAATPVTTPSATPSPRATQPAQPRTASPTPRPSPTVQEPVLREVPPPVDIPQAGPIPPQDTLPSTLPTSLPTQPPQADNAEAEAAELTDYWPWLAGLFGLLLAAGAVFFVMRRRGEAPPPTIEPPIVGEASSVTAMAAEKPRFELMLEVQTVSRSFMMLTVKYHLAIANRSDRALRDLEIHADLTSAHRNIAQDAQLASLSSDIALVETIERIGPHQSRTTTGTLQIPVQELAVFAQGQTPMVVPLIRLRAESSNADPVVQTFVVGIPSNPMGGRFQPLSLDGPPGSYQGVRAKALA